MQPGGGVLHLFNQLRKQVTTNQALSQQRVAIADKHENDDGLQSPGNATCSIIVVQATVRTQLVEEIKTFPGHE